MSNQKKTERSDSLNEEMYVTKRNGKREIVSFDKILNMIFARYARSHDSQHFLTNALVEPRSTLTTFQFNLITSEQAS